MKVSDFDFELPLELIASAPLPDRAISRMIVADSIPRDMHISDLPDLVRPGDVVVFNESRVIPARFTAHANDGTEYEFTLHTPGEFGDKLQDKYWAFAKRFQKLNIGDILNAGGHQIEILDKNDDSGVLLKFNDNVLEILEQIGRMPLPPYIKREEVEQDRMRYQTVYARVPGSLAAPTAGLHFTDELMEKIKARGAQIVKVTLHIGAGTWLPVKVEDTNNHKMHSEWGVITADQADIINAAQRVVAVGTTSLRLLETAATGIPPSLAEGGDRWGCPVQRKRMGNSQYEINPGIRTNIKRTRIQPFCGSTDIFITPGYKFKAVDVLLTNFHLPKSTLFMLVSAFAGLDEMKALYAHAVAEKYRFFSYGDCCLLFKK